MDTNIRDLFRRIQGQLGRVLRDSGHELSSTLSAGDCLQDSSSADQFKPDESGISSEEGCLPGPGFSKLANVATLIQELETKLETHFTAYNSSPRHEEESGTDHEEGTNRGFTAAQTPVVLGPPGTQPQPGKTLARYDRCPSVVYSRSSSQLVTCGTVPNTTLALLKDSRASHRAEVTIPTPSDGERRWTRAGARAIISAYHPGVSYLEESDSSSSDFSSSDQENGVYVPSVERKKKRRCRRQLLMESQRGNQSAKRVISMATSPVGEGDIEMDDWDGGVQMECEVGEDIETQSPFFKFPSPQALPDPPVVSTNTSPPRIFTVYDDLTLFQSHQKVNTESVVSVNSHKAVDGGTVSDTWRGEPNHSIRPCAVNITNLPRHIVNRHLHSVPADKQKSSVALAGRCRRDSTSSEGSTSSSNSSASVSMLSKEPSCPGSSKSGQTDASKCPPVPSTSVLPLTPQRRRLGSGRPPVARRSFPFSKPPSTPTVSRTVSPMIKGKERAGFIAVPVDWSPDEDFEDNPAPSVIISPLVQCGTGVFVKREKKSEENPTSKSSPANSLKGPPGSKSGTQGGSLRHPKSADPSGKQEGGSSSIARDRVSPRKKSPTKNAAHSVTEEGNNLDNDVNIAVPAVIDCAGCGSSIRWETQQIHKHKQLDVLICQDCWKVYHTGTFDVVGGSEIYCTLCGDGGNLVCCDNSSCTSSFCQKCIERTAGKEYFARLLEEDSPWECFCCDRTPLSKFHKLCHDLCEYYKRNKQRRKDLARLHGKAQPSSDTDSDSVLKSVQHSNADGSSSFRSPFRSGQPDLDPRMRPGRGSKARVSPNIGENRKQLVSTSEMGEKNVLEDEEGGEGEGGSEQGLGDKQTGESGQGGKEEGDGGRDKESKEGGDSGGNDERARNRRRQADLSDSDSETDSSDVDDISPQVDTDDISFSDASLFDGQVSSKKNKTAKNSEKNPSLEKSAKVQKEVKLEPKNGSSHKKGGGPMKKKRMPYGVLARRAVLSSDSDSDFESFVKKGSPLRKRVLSSGSLSSSKSEENKIAKVTKKNRLLKILSSGSDDEEESPMKMEETVPNFDNDGENPLTPDDSPGLRDKPIIYATPRKMSLSSDSEEVTVLERKVVKKTPNSDKNGGREGSEKRKGKMRKRVRKKKDDSSGDDFEGGDFRLPGVQLKRRRVMRALSSDSDSDHSPSESVKKIDSGEEAEKEDEEEEKSTPGRKRKKIHKLLTDEKLQDSTKEAQKMEKERIERLRKRQASLSEKEDELILEQDPVTKEPQVKVRQSLVKEIKDHQWEGIRFLYDACIEKLEMFKGGKNRSGAILAHCMGLGKSLQVIAFLDALLMHEDSGVSRVLILSPVNTIYNWRNEYEKWIPVAECEYSIYLLVDSGTEARTRKLDRWFRNGGVLFAGYELFRNLVMGKNLKRHQKSKKEAFEKYLLDPGPDIIVCDEGHVMRNSASNLSTVLQKVRTLTRIVLTGTPLQNNLTEYHTMVSFVKPNLLGTIKEFKNRFANPITNGQCRDSNSFDVRLMKNRAHVLHELLSGTVQRRDYRVLARFLPPKQEFVVFIRLSPVQEKLYVHYLNKSAGQHTASDLFSTFSNLQKVWNHPWVLKLDEDRKFERDERRRIFESDDDEDSLDGFIVFGSDEEVEEDERRKKKRKQNKPQLSEPASLPSSTDSLQSTNPSGSRSIKPLDSVPSDKPTSTTMLGSSDDDMEFPEFRIKPDPDAPPPAPKTDKRAPSKSPLPENLAPGGNPGKSSRPSSRSSSPQEWYNDILTADCEGSVAVSGKLIFLLELLQEASKLKEKVLVFTQSLLTLDLIEDVLSRPENGEWTPGLDYYRLDGSTRSEMRTHQMSDFNEVDNEQLRLFLISTRAGSLGVNLVAANRVVIFDACWNPSHDLQAVFRTYRFGQTKPIFVYRLLAKGTMEEKIYDRQVTKESLAMRVVDEKQIGRHYTASDLAELFTYSPAPPPPPEGTTPTYKKPEADNVLSSILEGIQPKWVINYHEHDSLLEHVFSEELSEEERKAAWEEYRAQMTQESRNYYNYQSLQSQLDTGSSALQTASVATADPTGSRVTETWRERDTELLTVLTNANTNVLNLIGLLREKAMLTEHQRRGIPLPSNLTPRALEEKITKQYRLVGEGVQRVNSTLQRCHDGGLSPTVNQLANQLRSELLRNLDVLRSGSDQLAVNTSNVAAAVRQAAHLNQLTQQHIQERAQAQRRAILMQHQMQQAGRHLKH